MARKRQHATRNSKRRRRRRIMARQRQHDAHKPKKRRQRGGKFDIQKKIEKLGIEFHPFSLSKRKRYQYLGPGTFLKKTTGTRWSWYQLFGQTRQTTRYRLFQCQKHTRQMESWPNQSALWANSWIDTWIFRLCLMLSGSGNFVVDCHI